VCVIRSIAKINGTFGGGGGGGAAKTTKVNHLLGVNDGKRLPSEHEPKLK
jgi:hypothetical protein